MHTLSFYEGSFELSFALGDAFFRFPYTYSDNLFSNSFSKEKFYKDVFELAAKNFKVPLTECEIKACGVLDTPKIPFDVSTSFCLLTHLPENHIFVDFEMIATQGDYNSYIPVDVFKATDNFQANLAIYPNLICSDTYDVHTRDRVLRAILGTSNFGLSIPSGSTVVLTGDRLSNFGLNEVTSYLLSIDAIKAEGVFFIKVDTQNIFPHTLMQKDTNTSYSDLGTLVNSYGSTECLYETEVGTSQIIDLDADKVFVVPLEKGGEARLMCKNFHTQFDQKVYGGNLGVVIDTRDKTKGVEFKEANIEAINHALSKL